MRLLVPQEEHSQEELRLPRLGLGELQLVQFSAAGSVE